MLGIHKEVDYAIDFQMMRNREIDLAHDIELALAEALPVKHSVIESSFTGGDKVIITMENGFTYELAIQERIQQA